MTPPSASYSIVRRITSYNVCYTKLLRLPLEATSLAVLIVLVTVFQLFPYEPDGVRLAPSRFLEGFGNEALITICALLVGLRFASRRSDSFHSIPE